MLAIVPVVQNTCCDPPGEAALLQPPPLRAERIADLKKFPRAVRVGREGEGEGAALISCIVCIMWRAARRELRIWDHVQSGRPF